MKKHGQNSHTYLQNKPDFCRSAFAGLTIRLKESILEAMNGHSRYEIAGRMGTLLGHEVKKWQLDAWASDQKYQLPRLDEIAAFCIVTETIEPLKIAVEPLHAVVLKIEDVVDEAYIESVRRELNARLIQKSTLIDVHDRLKEKLKENQDKPEIEQ